MKNINSKKELLINEICNLIKGNPNLKMISFISCIPTTIKNKHYVLDYIQMKDNSQSIQINYQYSNKTRYTLMNRLNIIFEPLNILDLFLIKTKLKNRKLTKKPYFESEIII
jgi:hypothetical protein